MKVFCAIFYLLLKLNISYVRILLLKGLGEIMSSGFNADLHIHTRDSLDGGASIAEVIVGAKDNAVSLISVTDHNTIDDIAGYWKAHGLSSTCSIANIDGVDIIPGVEVTCTAGAGYEKCKVHVLLYGVDMSEDSPIRRLLDIKHENDFECDLGLIQYIIKAKNLKNISLDDIKDFIQLKREQIPGFTSFSKDAAWEFFEKQGVTVAKSFRDFQKLCERAPRYERLNIPLEDLMKCVKLNSSNGKKNGANPAGVTAIVAHPSYSLRYVEDKKAMIDYLIDSGVDGFELMHHSTDDSMVTLIKERVKKSKNPKKMIYTGGSDFHNFLSGNAIGKVGGRFLPREAVASLEDEMWRLRTAREKSNYKYNPSINKEAESVVDYYNRKHILLKIMAESTPGDVVTVEVPKKEKPAKDKAKKKKKKVSPRERRQERQEELTGARYNIEDFESVHEYLNAIEGIDDESSGETYEEYLKRMDEEYSVQDADLLEDDEYDNPEG